MQATAVSVDQLTDELMQFLTMCMKPAQSEAFQIVEDLDLSFTQVKLLFVIDNADVELTPSELARHVGLSPAATGRAIDGMARAGLVQRREDERDRRVKRISLSDRGRDAAQRVASARRDGIAQILRGLDADQRAALSSALVPLTPQRSPEA
jgi:DNA-binding MarR family transcriptional regulator